MRELPLEIILCLERYIVLVKNKSKIGNLVVASVVVTASLLLPAVSANAASMTHHLTATAKGQFEGAGKGAMAGFMTTRFDIDLTKNTLCYIIKTHGITGVTGAHIHTGAAGVNGSVAVPLDPTKIGVSGKTCVPVDAKVLADIAANPAIYYFNAHTAKYPGGAVRGQLK